MRVVALACLTVAAVFGNAETKNDSVHVTVRWDQQENSWSAGYSLPWPVQVFKFAQSHGGRIRSESWSIVGDGLELKGGVVESDLPFDEFTLILRTDLAEYDRIYPAVINVGEVGSIVNTSYLIGRQPTNIELLASTHHVLIPGMESTGGLIDTSADLAARNDEPRYVYAGLIKPVSKARFQLLVGPNIPDRVAKIVEQQMASALDEYTLMTSFPLKKRPVLYVTHRESTRTSWRGDVASNLATSLRFMGDEWKTMTEQDIVTRVRPFVRHEAFHYWNSDLFRPRDASGEAWLHEGTADYFARQDSATAAEMVEKCWEARPTHDVPRSGTGVYRCGHAVNLIGDLLLKETGTTMVEAWRSVFRESNDGRYDASALFQAAVAQGAPEYFEVTARAFIGTGRPELLKPIMELLHLNVDYGLLDKSRLQSALMHLLKGECPSGYGFWTNEDHLVLDAANCAGGLVDRAKIVSVDGASLLDDPRGALSAFIAKCGKSDPLVFSTLSKSTFSVICAGPFEG